MERKIEGERWQASSALKKTSYEKGKICGGKKKQKKKKTEGIKSREEEVEKKKGAVIKSVNTEREWSTRGREELIH